ncbi:MAG: tRNA uridine-5-carboxymethylaminomethyl(34) synthesis GTPase MnmE [Candidatus Cloacimonetes bacterium]|nr:tRNA uridine-5-carboxymethylaminomethyl(34) synthesis GTPase MnmE [Candidatus Cloacimonadota bacterium]
MQNQTDTIVAISTPAGTGGISIVRLSGADSIQILSKSYQGKTSPKNFKNHSIYFGKVFDGNQLIDDVLVSVFIAPHSYTGEDVIEISCHGGNFVTQQILQIMLRNGARMAMPGEFTKRAFLNGKMDLTEAEAVIDLIQAKTKHSQEAAIFQLEGKLYSSIKSMLDRITELRCEIELDLDFSEQGLEYKNTEEFIRELKDIKRKISLLVNTGDEGIILNEGYKVVIAGEPNAGKSSLFNKIVENERAIVTEIPGTTRDYIEEDIALEGYLVKLFDTAGMRKSKDRIEKVGIEKSADIIKQADLILWVHDITINLAKVSNFRKVLNKDVIEVFNKIDLVKEKKKSDDPNIAFVSALSGQGVSDLKKKIINRIDLGKYDISHGLISNTRQLAAAKKSLQAIKQAINTTQKNLGLEFIAFDLREASEALEEIIGKVTSEEIINSIFGRFCVGK